MLKKLRHKKSASPIKNHAMIEDKDLLDTTTSTDMAVSLANPPSQKSTSATLDISDKVELSPQHTPANNENILPQENAPQAMTNKTSEPVKKQTTTDVAEEATIPDTFKALAIQETDTANNFTASTSKQPSKIKLTGRMLSFSRLHIVGDDMTQIKAQLDQKFAKQLNSKMLLVLSCEEKLDLADLLDHLWGLNLQPIGIVTGKMDEQAVEQKLAIFPADGKRIDVLAEEKNVNKASTLSAKNTNDSPEFEKRNSKKSTTHVLEKPTTPLLAATSHLSEVSGAYTSSLPQTSHLEGDLVYSTILRSGQSINHVGGDLILTQGINAGAEAITDYSLHVYGKAEGRLVAGATGDENARVFCLRFNPSLVSVAGTFCLRENIPSEFLDKAVQVSYERDKGLVFHLMNP